VIIETSQVIIETRQVIVEDTYNLSRNIISNCWND